MSSKTKNSRMVILNADRPRVLRLGHKAMKMLSKMLNKGLDKIGTADITAPETVETVIYCMALKDAQKNGENLKLEDMEDILDEVESYQDIIDAIEACFEAAFPGSVESAKNLTAAAAAQE